MTVPVIREFLNGASPDLVVDGSGAAVTFSVSGPFVIRRVVGCLRDDTGNPTPEKFGALTALTNGCLLQWTDGTTTTSLTPQPIQTNLHWAELTGVDFNVNANGYGIRCSFNRWTGASFSLPTSDYQLQFVIRDNLAGLDEFLLFAHGYIIGDWTGHSLSD